MFISQRNEVSFVELEKIGHNSFRPKHDDTFFNLDAVPSDVVSLRTAACIDLLYARARLAGGAPMELVQGIRSRRQRVVRFCTDQKTASASSENEPVTYIVPGGTASWKWMNGTQTNSRRNDPTMPVAERDDERICCKPAKSNVLNFGPYVPVVWHEMTHIFTMLQHGTWIKQGATFEEPSSPNNIAWQAFIERLRQAAPAYDKDPVTDEPDAVQSQQWVCNCGLVMPS